MTTCDLLAALRAATAKYDIASALDAIESCKSRVPFDPLIEKHATDIRWLVRRAAIGALGNCSGDQVEPVLLGITATLEDPDDLVRVNVSLGRVGTTACIAYLEKSTSHPANDVATSAIAALERLGSLAQLPVFVRSLQDPRWTVKWYAMSAIEKHGDATAVTPVLDRVKRILGRARNVPQGEVSELMAGLTYLWRHRSTFDSVNGFFLKYLPDRMQRLTTDEIEALCRLRSGG